VLRVRRRVGARLDALARSFVWKREAFASVPTRRWTAQVCMLHGLGGFEHAAWIAMGEEYDRDPAPPTAPPSPAPSPPTVAPAAPQAAPAPWVPTGDVARVDAAMAAEYALWQAARALANSNDLVRRAVILGISDWTGTDLFTVETILGKRGAGENGR